LFFDSLRNERRCHFHHFCRSGETFMDVMGFGSELHGLSLGKRAHFKPPVEGPME
jgi:hypothetical protein